MVGTGFWVFFGITTDRPEQIPIFKKMPVSCDHKKTKKLHILEIPSRTSTKYLDIIFFFYFFVGISHRSSGEEKDSDS